MIMNWHQIAFQLVTSALFATIVGIVLTFAFNAAIKRLEDASELIRRHAWAMVAHYNDCLVAVERRCSLEKHFDRRAWCGEPA